MLKKDALILVVDDDRDFLEIFSAKLNAQGYKTATALDGIEAVEKAKQVKPTVILMDIQMPKKDGVQAMLDLIADEETKKIPIIFLTSLGDAALSELNRKFAKQIGARDYFRKSDNYDILMSRISSLVSTH